MTQSENFNDPKGYTESVLKEAQNFTCGKHTISLGVDYIAVAGSAEGGWGQSVGERYMFINQAIRALYTFPEPIFRDNYPKIQRVLIVFQFKYTSQDIKLINEYTQRAKAKVIYVRSVDDFINFLNARENKKRIIKALEIYSHGIIDNISFHYSNDLFEDDREPDGLFNKESVNQINNCIFERNSIIKSYACRTGISIDKEDFSKNEYAGQNESLAQYMANTLNVTVYAFEKRTLYGNGHTYGNRKKIMSSSMDKVENIEKKDAILIREVNEKSGAGPIMPTGAFDIPIAGETPKGLSNDMQKYIPKN